MVSILYGIVSLALLISYIVVIPWLHYKIIRDLRKKDILYCLLKGILSEKSLTFSELDEYIDIERKKLKNQMFLFCSWGYNSFYTKPLIRRKFTANSKYREIIREFKDLQFKSNAIVVVLFLVYGSLAFSVDFMGDGLDIVLNYFFSL